MSITLPDSLNTVSGLYNALKGVYGNDLTPLSTQAVQELSLQQQEHQYNLSQFKYPLGIQNNQDSLAGLATYPGQIINYDLDKQTFYSTASTRLRPPIKQKQTNLEWLDSRINEMRVRL